MAVRSILIVGGGTAGWLTAAYLARHFALNGRSDIAITLLESPGIGIIGVGEGAFPTMRTTLAYLGIDESRFLRTTAGTFKQGVRFVDWAETPADGRHHAFLHPFEPPFAAPDGDLVAQWLGQDPATRPPFAEAVTLQHRVAEARRAPKRAHDGDFDGPLTYAYHFDAGGLAALLAERARELGVRHLSGTLGEVAQDEDGTIRHIVTPEHGVLAADLFVDCSGFRAALIDGAMDSRFHSVRGTLFTDRAIACKLPYDRPDAPIESATIAIAHEAGWIWDIGLAHARGLGCVYSSAHMEDAKAEAIFAAHVGARIAEATLRRIPFTPGWRPRQWVGNCVAIGLAAGFVEPLESTGVVLIEAAAAMLAELLPRGGPIDAPAARFDALMTARFEAITAFLKLHYCLSRRSEPFWRDNADPATIPERLRGLLDQWRYRPPSRFDFDLDVESFAWFNYQYILYGMGFRTDIAAGAVSDDSFARVRGFAERAAEDLPSHRALIARIRGEDPLRVVG